MSKNGVDNSGRILELMNPVKKGNFFQFPIAEFESLLTREPEHFWNKIGFRRALFLFHRAAERVPAYKDFLDKNKIHHEKIKTLEDFASIPSTNKKNYISEYSLGDRSWEGRVDTNQFMAVSSGMSGEPTFWPRGGYQEFEAVIIHELLYRYLFRIDKHKTLLVIGFPMGVYVSGVATLLPSWLVSQKGYQLTVASVGNNKSEFLRVIKFLQSEYEQIVLVGHPFFIKDVIETGRNEGIHWGKKRLRMMFCSEGFSEEWRRYLIRQANIPFTYGTAISTYGSSEFLLAGHETPFTNYVRNELAKNKVIKEQFIGSGPIPNIFQYNPLFRFIERVDNELVFTSASGVPLIRFNLHDVGKIVSFGEARKIFPKKMESVWNLPLVTLSGRSDQTIIFYAANIYPEHIHAALNRKEFFKLLTGKFAMRKGYLKNMDEYLEVNLELKRGIKPSKKLSGIIQEKMFMGLCKICMEYKDASSRAGDKARPRVNLHLYQSNLYFKPGLKPKYILS